MIVHLPREPVQDAVHLVGLTRRGGDPGPVLRGAVVLKAAYDLVTAGAGPRKAVPAADPNRCGLVYADRTTTGGVFALTREADIALEKGRTDLFVQGHVSDPNAGGWLDVAGASWLERQPDPAPAPLPDIRDNLFGWMSRTEDGRSLAPAPFNPAVDVLPAPYTPAFNNAYRRGGRFSTPGDRNTQPLPSGATVQIYPNANRTGEYAFSLPALERTARLRAYCGHGPDQARRWRVVDEIALTADTLIVEPGSHQIEVLWRASWDHQAVRPDRWRMVQIFPGGA